MMALHGDLGNPTASFTRFALRNSTPSL